MKLSSKALACGQSPMRKFHPYAVAAAAAGKKIYHLNIGQPDIHTPDALYDAIHNFRTPVLAYAASPGIPELIEAIRKYYENIGVQLNESDILITTGGSEALQIAANCLLDDGDEVIVPEPFYPNYHTFITTAGGVIHPLHTKPEEGYFYADRARIEACITPKTKAIMITNPGNPTGTCLTEAQMKMLLDVAVAHDLYLVADEVYREFTYDGEPLHSFGKFDYGQENLILIDSVSKRFSACGARVGMLISKNKELMAQAMKWCQCRLCSATVDQIGAAALYNDAPDYATTLTAQGICRCLLLDQELLDRLLGEEALLRRNYLTYLTGRIRFLNARLGSLAVGDTEGRVVRYLLSSLSYGAVECSASGLARQLGISRASVYRAFQDLEQAGLIRREGRAILVPDPAALEGVRGSG